MAIKLQTFHHLYGIGNHFIMPQGRNEWWPLNDSAWEQPPQIQEAFLFVPEAPLFTDGLEQQLRVRLKIAAESADERFAQALREEVLRDLARDLKASLSEDQLAEAIDHLMQYDRLFR